VLEQYGGHTHAAGLSLSYEQLPAFKSKFQQIVAEKITEDILIPTLHIDLLLNLDWISFKFLSVLKQMQPFGPENMTPIFASEEVVADSVIKTIKGEHIKMFVKQQGSHRTVEAVGFGLAHYYEQLLSGKPFKIAYQVVENEYKGRVSLQLMLKDIQFYA